MLRGFINAWLQDIDNEHDAGELGHVQPSGARRMRPTPTGLEATFLRVHDDLCRGDFMSRAENESGRFMLGFETQEWKE